MPPRFPYSVFLALALWGGMVATAPAGDLADFNAAVEAVSAQNRAAIGYLHTGNTDLAGLAIDRMREAWHKLTARYAGHPPDAFDGNPLYATTFTGIDARLVAADMMLSSGRSQAARQSLQDVRDDLHKLRQASHIVVLADCVGDSSRAADALMVYDKRDLDWSKPETRYAIAGKAAIYGHVLDRCDQIASVSVRKDPEFRRLVDGARDSLGLIPQAIAERDTGLLHRVLIELRAIDNLLAFRFG